MHDSPLGDCDEPLRPESALCVNIEALAFAAALVDWELQSKTKTGTASQMHYDNPSFAAREVRRPERRSQERFEAVQHEVAGISWTNLACHSKSVAELRFACPELAEKLSDRASLDPTCKPKITDKHHMHVGT